MKVEIEITKNEMVELRRFLNLKTQTPPVACLRSLLNIILNQPQTLMELSYERIKGS